MKREKESYCKSSSCRGWWDKRTLLATVVLIGIVLFTTQNVVRILKLPCPVTTPPTFSIKPIALESTDEGAVSDGRKFRAFGLGAYLFVDFSTYRGGPNSFSIIGLASKPIHVFGKPTFACEWVPEDGDPVVGRTHKMLPDWGYGRVYTVVVINCSFPVPVGTNSTGGKLVLYASSGDHHSRNETFIPLREKPGDYRHEFFHPDPYPYDFVYCGSPLYGSLNPYRIREWLAYHMRLFGPRSLFILYDVGGINETIRKILEPWIEKGRLIVDNVRSQKDYDGYYYNQFVIVNDCLHRSRFLTKWAFYFDVDEYLYVAPKSSLLDTMNELSTYTQITYDQSAMSNHLCLATDEPRVRKRWGFEKLVFRNARRNVRRDRKYVIQPWAAMATGIHMSENVMGKTLHSRYPKLKYYHYHNSINVLEEVCKVYVNDTRGIFYYEKEPYELDTGMRELAIKVKRFEKRELPRPSEAVETQS